MLRSLLDTVAWCASQDDARDPLRSLRSPILCPAELSLAPPSSAAEIELQSDALWQLSADQIAERVELLVKTRRASLVSQSTAPQSGLLLAYDPAANLADGFAAQESAGFFDCDNAPPWDTWVTFVRNKPRSRERWSAWDFYIVAWVPSALISHAQRGIDGNPEECIRWLRAFDRLTCRRWKPQFARTLSASSSPIAVTRTSQRQRWVLEGGARTGRVW